MSRARLTLIALGMTCALPAFTRVDASPITSLLLSPAAGHASAALSGTWRSAANVMPLTTAFDESVWGKNAKSIRTVQLVIQPAGQATLTVTRKVVDARGRTIQGSTSLEHFDLVLGELDVERSNAVRCSHAATVKHAERRYPDEPEATWTLDGLRVGLATFNDNPAQIEVRVDYPEGRGSFWETLRRTTRSTHQRVTCADQLGAGPTVQNES